MPACRPARRGMKVQNGGASGWSNGCSAIRYRMEHDDAGAHHTSTTTSAAASPCHGRCCHWLDRPAVHA